MAKKKTLCLVMIVKNESKVIHRCLDSIRDYLDYWVIHDTGSTDNTPSLIETYFQNAKIPGKLYHTPWTDFGYNRTQAVQSARNKADYLILMDADFICQIKDPLFKTKPMDADAYMIKYEGPLDYRQNLFVKGSLSWKYVGVTHEYIHCPESKQVESGDFLTFIHPGDGGCRSDKFERDIRLLHQGLEKEPKNIRYMFYLAQSYKDVQDWNNAVIWYQKRIDAGGWPEEVYYAMYQIGMCKMRRGDSFYNFMGDLVAAFMFRPIRLEALFHLIHYCYQNKGLSIIGYQLGKMAINTEYPKDLLFVEKAVHDYLFLDALSICAVNAGKFKKACQIIKRILSEGLFPERDRQRLESNQMVFKQRYQEYLNKIKGQDLQKIKQQPRWALKTPEEALEANQSTALAQAQAQAVAKAEAQVQAVAKAQAQSQTVAKAQAQAQAQTVAKAETKTPSTDKGFSILNPTKSVEVNAQNTNESQKTTSGEVAQATNGEAEKSNSEDEKVNNEAKEVKIRSLTVRKNPIWISLTSIPSRMGRLTKTLESLKAQTTKATRINLCLPEKCLKESAEYQIPPEIANDPAITIVRTANDWGPATKLIGSLCICDDPETRLIVVDDDIIYPSDLVAKLVARSRDHPDSAIGFCGWQAKDVQKGREHFYRNLVYEDRLVNLPYITPVDVLEGYRGVLSKRRFWDLEAVLDYSQAPKSAFFVDDVWLSGHLARRLVPRLAFKYDQGATLTADQAYGRVWVANQPGSKEQNNSLSTRVDFVEANQQTAQYFWNSEGQLHRTVDEVQTYMTKEIQKKMTLALKAMPEASSLHEVQIKSRIQANYQSAIIIPTYNRPEYLQWTLKTLTGSQLPDDCLIILIDDASESNSDASTKGDASDLSTKGDGSSSTESNTKGDSSDASLSKTSGRVRQLLEQMNGPSVISCYKSSNQGVFHSLRLGIKIAQIFNVQRYCLLDSDTMVRSDWFTRLTDFYDNNRECLVSGFNLGNRQHHVILESLAGANRRQSIGANRRQSIGGVNMYFSADLATKFLPLMNDLRWDYQVCLWCQMNRVPIFTLKPSVVQHIGIKGMFSNPEKQNSASGAGAYDFDFAYDFYLDVAPEFGKDRMKDQMKDQVKDQMKDQVNKDPEYCWLPGVDFPGFNLEQVLDEAGITAIKARASQNSQVVAWNASGWLKTKLEAPNKWEIEDVNRSLGLFVKRSAYSEFGLGQLDKLGQDCVPTTKLLPLLRNSQSEYKPMTDSDPKITTVSPKIVLLLEDYRPNNPTRFKEIQNVFSQNLTNPLIDQICLFSQFSEELESHRDPKVRIIPVSERLTYEQCFQWINQNLASGTICIVANADIYYDQSLSKLKTIKFDNLFMALLRYDLTDDQGTHQLFANGQFPHADAQDSWIFKAPIKMPAQCDFYFGKAGCDNRLAFEMLKTGYNLINCPYDIKIYHYHLSEYRTYEKNDPVAGPYLNLIPSHLEETMMIGHHHENFARHHENFARNYETKYHFWGLEKTECAGLTQNQILNHLISHHE